MQNKEKAASQPRKTTARGQRAPKGVLRRLLRTLFEFYPVLLPVTLVCILINAIVSATPAIFMQNIIAIVDDTYKSGDWASVSGKIFGLVAILVTMYVVSLIAGFLYTQMMAIITQGSLKKMREKMFDHMQDLPIKYFDTNGRGDIMSYYTNDVDTLRQMISQSLPQMLISGVTLLTIFCIMMYYSVILGLIVVAGVVCMTFAARYITSHSSKYFLRQQVTLAKAEAFMEEMMTGQKVVKVFCHEDGAKEGFDKVNGEIFYNARNGNRFANVLMPLLGNIGNVMYVIVALVGGALMLTDIPNISISGMAFGISIVVPFLNMTKQFAGAIGQVSNQVNMVIMGLAGAHRLFALLDEQPETDEGYVTLVNAREKEDGTIEECSERTGMWAWKHPHHDGTLTYTRLMGDVRFFDVNFGYTPEKTVLHKHLPLRQARPEAGLRRLHRRGQDHHHQPHQPLLRHQRRQDPLRRHQHQQDQEGRSAPLAGYRLAGHQPLHRHGDGEHPLRQAGRHGRGVRRRRQTCRCGRLHPPPARGLRHQVQGNGANLSQGQRQLLAIARAAVADPP